ncbi:MAG: VWA domain-containing protein [Oligoflexales bacterium]
MKKMIKTIAWSYLCAQLSITGTIFGKSIKNKYGVTKNGKIPQGQLEEIAQEVIQTKSNMSQAHYEDLVAFPSHAQSEEEKLAILSAREIFVMVDRSGSMGLKDDNPTGRRTWGNWNRWDSARVAAESISELAISLDADNKVELIFWSGGAFGLKTKKKTMSKVNDISKMFKKHEPDGGTPLAEALQDVYKTRLKSLLNKSEPFTVLILTDGAPDNEHEVKDFFAKIIRENNLQQSGRETLAAFSFIRMGDDPSAIKFLENLDDNLPKQLNVSVDIVDTKEDNFLFGTGKFANHQGIGPLAVFWDAIFD